MVTKTDFPADFLWGASTASYQIEGAHDVDGRAPSIWDMFSHTPGKTLNGETGDIACDHYHRYAEDVALMKKAGLGAYRFSISWSRVMPEGRGAVNEAGLDFYDRLVDELLANGVAPWACLYHWDLPLALHNNGLGWPSRDIVPLFADYAGLMAKRLGDRVGHWATFNEPGVFAYLGYAVGIHAPGIRDYNAWLDTIHNVNLSHGAAVRRLRADLPATARIGAVPNVQPSLPASGSEADKRAAALLDAGWNRGFPEPVYLGRYDPIMREQLGDRIRPGDEEAIHTKLDFFGLNHYSPMYAKASGDDFGFRMTDPPEGVETTLMGWHVLPSGFRDTLVHVSERYGAPVYVTENGVADEAGPGPDGKVDDPIRVSYLDRYLGALVEARAAGADVRGYFVWSMTDNFEWAMGFKPRFGITHIDYATQKRTPKSSYHWLAGLTGAA